MSRSVKKGPYIDEKLMLDRAGRRDKWYGRFSWVH